MKKVKIYEKPFEQARADGEIDQWRASLDRTMECCAALETAVAAGYDGYSMSGVDVEPVVKEYGYPRIYMVLANAIMQHRGDHRISREVSAWAETVPIYPNRENGYYFSINSVSPGIVSLLVEMVQKHQEQAKAARPPRVTLYKYSRTEAGERGELARWQASHDRNMEVARTLTEAIDKRCEDVPAAVRPVVEKYGIRRVMWVLANTVQLIDPTDPRIGADNRAWAKAVPLPPDGKDTQFMFYVRSNPCLVNTAIHTVQQMLQERSGVAQPPAERGDEGMEVER